MRSAFERPFELGWSFDVELLARLLHRQRSVGDIDVERQLAEFPLDEWLDTPGSKITWRHLPRIGMELARLYATVRRARRGG